MKPTKLELFVFASLVLVDVAAVIMIIDCYIKILK